MLNWLRNKIKQHYCKHKNLTYIRKYFDYSGWLVYVYKCNDCNKTVKRLIKS